MFSILLFSFQACGLFCCCSVLCQGPCELDVYFLVYCLNVFFIWLCEVTFSAVLLEITTGIFTF